MNSRSRLVEESTERARDGISGTSFEPTLAGCGVILLLLVVGVMVAIALSPPPMLLLLGLVVAVFAIDGIVAVACTVVEWWRFRKRW